MQSLASVSGTAGAVLRCGQHQCWRCRVVCECAAADAARLQGCEEGTRRRSKCESVKFSSIHVSRREAKWSASDQWPVASATAVRARAAAAHKRPLVNVNCTGWGNSAGVHVHSAAPLGLPPPSPRPVASSSSWPPCSVHPSQPGPASPTARPWHHDGLHCSATPSSLEPAGSLLIASRAVPQLPSPDPRFRNWTTGPRDKTMVRDVPWHPTLRGSSARQQPCPAPAPTPCARCSATSPCPPTARTRTSR